MRSLRSWKHVWGRSGVWALLALLLFALALPPQSFAFDHPRDDGHGRRSDPDDPPDPDEPPDEPEDECSATGSPVYLREGNLVLSFTDLEIKSRLPLHVERTYNSQDDRNGLIGRGWTHSFELRAIPITDGTVDGALIRSPNGQRQHFVRQPDGTYSKPLGCSLDFVGEPTGFRLTDGDVDYDFDEDGDLQRIVDRNGNSAQFDLDPVKGCIDSVSFAEGTIQVTYGANGKISAITGPGGATVTYVYDTQGNLVQVTDPLGNETTYAYDSAGRLVEVLNALGQTTMAVVYDSQGRVARSIDANGDFGYSYGNGQTTKTDNSIGATWIYQYDSQGVVTRITDPLGNPQVRTYDALYRLTAFTDRNGNTTTYGYDLAGHRTSQTDALGNVTQYTYTASGLLETETDPLGATTRYEYDALGNRTKIIEAAGTPQERVTTRTYDSQGNLTTQTDAAGNVSTYTYDPAGHVVQVTDVFGQTLSLGYDSQGNEVTRTDAAGNSYSFEYDAARHQTSVTSPEGRTTTFSYDAAGNQTAVTDPDGHTTSHSYDAYGRLVRVTDASGNETSYEYDAGGRRTKVTDAGGRTTSYTYNSRGLVATMTDGLGNVTTYSYDAAGNRTSVTNALGQAIGYEYDVLNRMTRIVYPDGSYEAATYDPLGRLSSTRDRTGQTTGFQYDALGQITEISYPDGSSTSLSWDAAGRLATATNQEASLSFTYDAAGRLLAETNSTTGDVVAYSYDAAGRLSRVTAPSGEVIQYTFDALHRLASVTSPVGTIANSFIPATREVIRSNPNGTTSTLRYDSLGHVTELTHAAAGSPFVQFQYTRDSAGNTVQVGTLDGVHDYQLDAAYRLTGATFQPTAGTPTSEFYQYDAAGNRVSSHISSTYTYDASGKLLSDDELDFSYDSAGRLIEMTDRVSGASVASFEYNGRGLVSRIDSPSGFVEYSYDPLGRRVRTRTQSGTIRHVYDSKHVLAEYDGSGVLLRLYVGVRGETPLAAWDGSAAYFYHADERRSVVAVTDGTGQVVYQCDFTSFGEAGCVIPPEFQEDAYVGRPLAFLDGFYDFRARLYDARRGRFITPDPRYPTEGYLYTHNDPINFVDPSGHTGVRVCVRPLAVFPDWLPWWASPANHAYIEIPSCNWSAGYQADDNVYSPEQDLGTGVRRCTPARKRNSGTLPDGTDCECATDAQLHSCVKSYASSNSYGDYSWWSHNCGHFVIATLERCCMVGSIPWHYYGPRR